MATGLQGGPIKPAPSGFIVNMFTHPGQNAWHFEYPRSIMSRIQPFWGGLFHTEFREFYPVAVLKIYPMKPDGTGFFHPPCTYNDTELGIVRNCHWSRYHSTWRWMTNFKVALTNLCVIRKILIRSYLNCLRYEDHDVTQHSKIIAVLEALVWSHWYSADCTQSLISASSDIHYM